MITNFGIFDRVKYLGYVPIGDLAILFNLAVLAFFPTRHENFCFPIVEAMSCGTPVVASKVYSIPEVVGNSAILCNPNDVQSFTSAIEKVMEEEWLREKMKKDGLENSKRFSWKKCATETIKIYKNVLNK